MLFSWHLNGNSMGVYGKIIYKWRDSIRNSGFTRLLVETLKMLISSTVTSISENRRYTCINHYNPSKTGQRQDDLPGKIYKKTKSNHLVTSHMIGDLLVAPSFMVASHLQIAELTTYPTLLASEKLGNTTDVMSYLHKWSILGYATTRLD